MSTQLDFSVGIGKESTYGAAVPPTRFFEAEAKMKLGIVRTQGRGLRPTKNVNRLNRSSLSRYEVSGEQQVEALTSGLGYLLNAVLGSTTNTVVAGAVPPVYMQVHTLTKSDPVASYTIEEVLPFLGGVGSVAYQFTGCVADTLDIDAKEGAAVDVKIGWLGRDAVKNVSPAAASYPANDELFTFVHGAIGLAGTLTPPTVTGTASLSGGTAGNITDISVSVKRNLDSGGYNLGGAGKRSRLNALGRTDITGKLTAELTDATLIDAYANQTPLPVVLTFTGPQIALGGAFPVYATLQIVLPSVLLKGELPTSNGGSVATVSADFEAYDNGTAAEPIWIVYRTLDTTP